MGKIRKEVKLSKEVVEAIQKKADLESRSWKQYVEMYLELLSKDRVIKLKD